jgi:GTP-binding protein
MGQKYYPPFTKKPLKISLIGKPNVGKSSLFNSIAGSGIAIVHPTEGITRDYQSYDVKDYKFPFTVTDTGGIMDTKNIKGDSYKRIESWKKQRKNLGKSGTGTWDSEKPDFFWEDVFNNVKVPLQDSDIIFFVVDVRNGITNIDFNIRNWIKQNVVQTDFLEMNDEEKRLSNEHGSGKLNDGKIYVNRVVLIANKCDEGELFGNENELYQLGLGDPVCVAAETGDGMHELWKVIDDSVPQESQDWFQARSKKRKQRYQELKN